MMRIILISMTLVGCTVIPTVQYKVIRTPTDVAEITDTFYRQRSEIFISINSEAKAKDLSDNDILITDIDIVSRPREYKNDKLGLRAVKDWRSSTMVNLNKIQNSDLINSIGVEVTDNTAKAINSYGGSLVKLVGLAAAAPIEKACISTKSGPNTIILPDELPKDALAPLYFDGSEGKKKCIVVKIAPLPADAIPADSIPTEINTHNYYYSACRDADVTLIQGGSPHQEITKTVRISDPRWLQKVQFPVKGTITHHSACGISVVTERTAENNGAAIVDALATQGKAIKDALDASRKK